MNKYLKLSLSLGAVFFGSFLLAQAATCAGIFVGGTGVCYGNGYVGGILAHTIPVGEGANQLATITPSTAGKVLTSNGTSADPSFQVLPGTLITAGTGISTTTSTGGAILVTNTGVTSLIAGTNISLSGSTGAVTITGTGGGGTGLSTTSPVSGGNLLEYSAVGAGAAFGVATSTLTPSSPLTGSFTQIGSEGALGCQTASGSQAGCLSSTDWTTFNNKGSGSVTSITLGNGLDGASPITTSGTITAQVGTSTVPTVGGLAYWTGNTTPSTLGTVATSSETCSSGISCTSHVVLTGGGAITLSTIANGNVLGFMGSGSGVPVALATSTLYGLGTNGFVLAEVAGVPTWTATSTLSTISGQLSLSSQVTGTLPAGNGGTGATSLSAAFSVVSNVFSSVQHRSFTYATSTSWTGTTTIPLESGYGETWNSVRCFTDAGTLGVDFYHSTNHLNYIPTASTTNNVNTFTTNNTVTSGDVTKVDIGTPASSPTVINCTLTDTQ